MNNMQEKQYLALELTKIIYPPIDRDWNKHDVVKTYENILTELTGYIADITTINTLQKEIERLTNENTALKKENKDVLKPFCEQLLTILHDGKIDMEPYLYDELNIIITNNMR